jgi:hypothetical protein
VLYSTSSDKTQTYHGFRLWEDKDFQEKQIQQKITSSHGSMPLLLVVACLTLLDQPMGK